MRTIIRSGILLILLGFLAAPFFPSAASLVKRPFANIVTGSLQGTDPSAVLLGEVETSFRPGQLTSLAESFFPSTFPLLPQQGSETITIHRQDCVTPATDFSLGETVCAKLTGAPVGTRIRRRLAIVNPAGLVVAKANVISNPQSLTLALPANAISTYEQNSVDNRGTWRVNNLSTENAGVKTGATFVLRDPEVPVASLSITKNVVGAAQVADGSVITFSLLVTNSGPDSAAGVQFTDVVPANSTFALTTQESGPTFTCVNPSGNTGPTCSIASLAKDASAQFRLVYQLNSGVAAETVIESTATISSTTLERHTLDNASTAGVTIAGTGGGGAACTLDCPNNITVTANTMQDTTPGANVMFPPVDSFGDCGTLSTSVASGSFFPVGSTTVSVSSTTGDGACSFVVTVIGDAAPTIACPANVSVETTDCAGATVSPGTPTATPSSVTITGERTDGQDLSATYPIGNTTITWTARDSDNRTATCNQIITVTSNDALAPTVIAPPDINTSTPAATVGSCGVVIGESVLGTADATDNCTVNVTRSGVPPGNFFPVGTTTITYTATDGAGNTATDTQAVVVTDGPPVIFAPAAATYVCLSEVPVANPSQATGPEVIVNGEPQPGPPADSCGAVTVTVVDSSTGAGSASDPMIITRTYTATDLAGNASSAVQIITVIDDTAPTITAPADTAVDADASCQAPIPDYVSGSTASDNCSTPTVTVTQSPAAGTLAGTGSHTVTVTATDGAGNSSTDTVVFTVNDTTAPTITAPADSSASADASCQAPVPDYAATSTASDNCSTATVTVTQSPAAGTLVGTGPHTVTVTATDGAGNSSTDTVVFTVNDMTAPTITAPADSSASADASCQAPVPDYAAASTASDNCGNPAVTQTPAAGTLVGTGSTTVTVTATDSAGNSSTDTVVLTVNDTTAPVFTCPADIVMDLPANTSATSMAVNFATPTATDNCSSAPTVTTSVASGSVFPVGTTAVNVTATDAAGNSSSCSFNVTVRYRFAGFFAPVANLPTLNVVNGGRALPVKFSLSGDKGLDIFAANSPFTIGISCDGNVPQSDVEETLTAGGSSLSYQSSSDQYHYVWKTENSWAGTCRQLVVKLNDGSEHRSNFKFR